MWLVDLAEEDLGTNRIYAAGLIQLAGVPLDLPFSAEVNSFPYATNNQEVARYHTDYQERQEQNGMKRKFEL